MTTIADGSLALATDLLVSLTSDGNAYHLQHGNDAAKSATPAKGGVYIAEDTGCIYVCCATNIWTKVAGPYAFDVTQVDCKATGPTTAFSFTLAANDLGADRGFFLELTGEYSIGGTGRTPTITLNFGAGSVSVSTAAIPLNTAGPFHIWLWLTNTTATAQKYALHVWFDDNNNGHYLTEYVNTFAVNTAVDVTVSVQIAWSGAVTQCNKEHAIAQLIG